MNALALDLRHALRSLIKTPSFTLVIVLTLALGIGANVAVFAVARGVLLRPLPFEDADRLVRLWSNHAERGLTYFSVSAPDYFDWQRQSRAFEAFAAFDRQRSAVLTDDARQPEEVLTARASAGLFQLLRISPVLGRTFAAAEDQPEERVAIVTEGLWRSALGSDPAVVGRSLTLDGVKHTIIGVMPPEFMVPGNPAVVWTPLGIREGGDRGDRYLRVFGRLRPGLEVDDAFADMRAVTARLSEQYPESNTGWGITIQSLNEFVVGTSFRRAVLVLLGVVGFVLLIACANVTNLFLSRAVARRQQAAVYLALGASRARVARAWLTESALLGLLGGIGGLLLGVWSVDLLRVLGESTVPRLDEVGMDAGVVAFTFMVALVIGVLLGVLPTVQTLAFELSVSLREGGRGSTGSRRTRRLRGGLVVAQVTLALVLLVGAALLLQSLWRIHRVELGFDPDGVLISQIVLPEMRYSEPETVTGFYTELVERARALPGVRSAAMVSSAPMAGRNSGNVFTTEKLGPVPVGNAPDTDYRSTTPGYFRTMGIALRWGRDFTDADRSGPEVVIVSETFARRFFPDGDVLGQRLRIGDIENGPWHAIVGVTADVRHYGIETPEVRPMVYMPHSSLPSMTLVLKTSGDASAIARGMRAELAAMDDQLAASPVSPLDEAVDVVFAGRRFQMVLFGAFAIIALVLAAVGMYGVTSYTVAQRTREIGVRIALGAHGAQLVRSIVRHGVALAFVGITLGLEVAYWLSGLIASLLFQTSATDVRLYAAVAALLLTVAALASWIPARRAARVEPLEALREPS